MVYLYIFTFAVVCFSVGFIVGVKLIARRAVKLIQEETARYERMREELQSALDFGKIRQHIKNELIDPKVKVAIDAAIRKADYDSQG